MVFVQRRLFFPNRDDFKITLCMYNPRVILPICTEHLPRSQIALFMLFYPSLFVFITNYLFTLREKVKRKALGSPLLFKVDFFINLSFILYYLKFNLLFECNFAETQVIVSTATFKRSKLRWWSSRLKSYARLWIGSRISEICLLWHMLIMVIYEIHFFFLSLVAWLLSFMIMLVCTVR